MKFSRLAGDSNQHEPVDRGFHFHVHPQDWYLAGCPIRCGTSSEMDAERGRRVSAVIIPSRFAASERRVRFDASDDADGFRQQQREKLQPGAMSRGRVLPLDEFSAITEFLTPVRTKVVLMI